MDAEHNIELIREAIADNKAGKLSDFSTIIAIDLIVNPYIPSQEDIDWARNELKEIRNEAAEK